MYAGLLTFRRLRQPSRRGENKIHLSTLRQFREQVAKSQVINIHLTVELGLQTLTLQAHTESGKVLVFTRHNLHSTGLEQTLKMYQELVASYQNGHDQS